MDILRKIDVYEQYWPTRKHEFITRNYFFLNIIISSCFRACYAQITLCNEKEHSAPFSKIKKVGSCVQVISN